MNPSGLKKNKKYLTSRDSRCTKPETMFGMLSATQSSQSSRWLQSQRGESGILFAADEAVAAQSETLVPTRLRPEPPVPDAEED